MTDMWISVCHEDDLVVGAGVCALLEDPGGEQQVALFRESDAGPIYAVSNYDPIGQAFVLSRGIIGSLGDTLVVASPLYKQHYSLVTGQCIEDASVKIKAWPVRVNEGRVELNLA